MRLLHTSDWHLGRQLHGVSLLEDQAHVLSQIVDIARDEAVDAVLIAGDVYDRAMPPAEAVDLLGSTLNTLCLELGCQVVVIAGNHDSPERLGFLSGLLDGSGLHMVGPLAPEPGPVTLQARDQCCDVFALPYAGPLTVRQVLGGDVGSHEAAMAALLSQVDARRTPDRRTVVMAHCFVDGGEESDSERPLSVGGADRVSADLFSGYDYVALGHLHRPQQRQQPHIRYSGSILKYSFSEVAHRKSVTLVDLAGDGPVRIEERSLSPLRDVRVIEGTLDTLLQQGATDPRRDDFIQAQLTDNEALLDVMGKLRRVYPNALQAQLRTRPARLAGQASSREMLGKSHLALFGEFFEEVQGDPLTEEQRDHLVATLDKLHAEGRL